MASSSILCDPCQVQNKNISGVNWCPGCDEILCTDCTSHHQSQKATKGHNLVDVNFKFDLPEKLSKLQYCSRHFQLQVQYFCHVHNVICCRACLADKHRSCYGVTTLGIACQNANKSLLEERGEEIKNINKSLANIQEERIKNTSDINTECKNIESKISQAKAKLINQINENENILLLELHKEQVEILRTQHDIKQKCQTIAENLDTHSKVMELVMEHGTEKQIFLLAHHLKPTVEKIDDSVSEIVKSTRTTMLHFDEGEYRISSIPSLGSINKLEYLSQVKHKPIKEKNAQCILPQTDKRLTSFKLTSKFRTSDFANILVMIVTEDNKLLLCNYTDQHEVLVYNDNGQCDRAITMKHWPYDIAVIPGGNQFVVTLPNIKSIQYINSKDLTTGRSVKLPLGSHTRGIAADKQYLYIGENEHIFVLNFEGTVVRGIQLEGSSIVTYLAIADNNVYAGNQNDKIYCIDQNETIRQTQVIGVGKIRKIIVDCYGYIYVVGEESGKVHRLNKDLKQNMTIGDDSVTGIGTICFNTNSTKLFVASKRGKAIAVFSCT